MSSQSLVKRSSGSNGNTIGSNNGSSASAIDNRNTSNSPNNSSILEAVHSPTNSSVYTGNECGGTLAIVKQFNILYEDRMKEIEVKGGGDCVKAKISLQENWIRDLTEQNAMLIEVVEDLEKEAAERVQLLEEKLRKTAENLEAQERDSVERARLTEEQLKKAAEVLQRYNDIDFSVNLSRTLQTVEFLQSDVKNAIQFVRRVRQDGIWSLEGLQFYSISGNELLGDAKIFDNDGRLMNIVASQPRSTNEVNEKLDRELIENKDLTIRTLQHQLNQLTQYGGIQNVIEKSKSYDALKISMSDMRDALTAEVADKHDIILGLRREIQQLEEQCLQSDKQTHFKDDIVRELRKELKHLKQHQRLSKRSKESNVPKKSYILIEDPDQYPVVSVKHDLQVPKPSNSTIIYIREHESVPVERKEREKSDFTMTRKSATAAETNLGDRLIPEKVVSSANDLKSCEKYVFQREVDRVRSENSSVGRYVCVPQSEGTYRKCDALVNDCNCELALKYKLEKMDFVRDMDYKKDM